MFGGMLLRRELRRVERRSKEGKRGGEGRRKRCARIEVVELR